MAACTFFGHRECSEEIRPELVRVLTELIEHRGVDTFYVGNQGRFDALVRGVLRELKVAYPNIEYAVVLAYMPGRKAEYEDFSDTMLPEGIEAIHPHFAISWRNMWLVNHSDYVVTNITHDWSGANRYAQKAKEKRKCVINLPNG